MKRIINVGTLFSGIGAFEFSLRKAKIRHNIIFANDIDVFCKQTYKENYKCKKWFDDICKMDAKPFRNKIDLLVGGSPCQAFSVNGKRGGFNDIRGTLFYEFIRVINEVLPKVFIFENVRGMLNHDHGNTWKTIKRTFKKLKYDIFIPNKNGHDVCLNAKDYGIPQNRERIFVVGIRKDIIHKPFVFPEPIKLTTTINDYLDCKVDAKFYLGKKGFNFVTTHPSRARVGSKIMGCQKANQQFNWNGDFIFEKWTKIKDKKRIAQKAWKGIWKGENGVIRKFTPRECLRLMGFTDEFKIIQNDQIMYRQSGNSIVVNVLNQILKEIFKTGAL